MPNHQNIFVVVATIREKSLARFLHEWKDEFAQEGVSLIVVEDNPQKSFAVNASQYPFQIFHYAWEDIEQDLKEQSWIIPRRTSAIKSYGFLKAHQRGAEVTIALDDDCYPLGSYRVDHLMERFIRGHLQNLFERSYREDAWMPSTRSIRPRGLPYENTCRTVKAEQVFVSHGLWANVPDLDGKTQLALDAFPPLQEYFHEQLVPLGSYFPMCGMNVAWKRDLTPAMYFMLMGKDRNEQPYGYDRFDDIWAGIYVKKILDHFGLRAYSGNPVIWHDRASNAAVNVEKEQSGIEANNVLWSAVDGIVLTRNDVKGCYLELAEKLPLAGDYWEKLKRAMAIWANLF